MLLGAPIVLNGPLKDRRRLVRVGWYAGQQNPRRSDTSRLRKSDARMLRLLDRPAGERDIDRVGGKGEPRRRAHR